MSFDLTRDKWPESKDLRCTMDGIYATLTRAEYDFARHRVASYEGLKAASLAIQSFIKEARSAIAPYGKRQGRKLEWWRGELQGLIAAKVMLALAFSPEHPENAKQITDLLARAKGDKTL